MRQKPGTPSLLRELNDRAALELLLAEGPLTRAQLSERTGVSKVTVSQMLARLEERALVMIAGEQAGGRGPNAALYSVIPSSAYVAGLYVEFDLVRVAVADVAGNRVADVSVNPDGGDDLVGLVREAISQACASAGIGLENLSAVVIGSPGVLDPRTGAPRLAVNLPTWQEGVLDGLREVLHTPVLIENDVNLAAMAERAGGAAAGLDDFAFVWLGVGLGLASVIGGEVRRGFGGAAGEIGWMPVHGAPLPVGNEHPGKAGLQALAGGLAVQALAAEYGFRGPTPADAIAAAIADLTRAGSGSGGSARRPRGPRSSMSSRSGSRSAWRRSASSSTPPRRPRRHRRQGRRHRTRHPRRGRSGPDLPGPPGGRAHVRPGRTGAPWRASGGPRAGPGRAPRLARLGVRLTGCRLHRTTHDCLGAVMTHRVILGVTAGDPAIIAAEHVVTPDGVLAPGWIRIADGRIEAVLPGEPPAPAARRAHWALPGFIDMHVHGGGGASFTEGGPDDARRAAAFHRAHGTTRTLASLVTAPVDRLERRVAMLADLADEGVIDGIHLEGPFLSAARCGAQDPALPDRARCHHVHATARRVPRLASDDHDRPRAARRGQVIRAAAAAGVIAAAGHTDASAEVTAEAIDAGISHATHLFNGMRPIDHRAPGPAGALLDRQVTCEVIADGAHLHDAIVRLAARAAGPGNLVLITDAMAAAGVPDGNYRLGELDVTVTGGVARLAGAATPGGTAPGGTGAIAGSTASMEFVVRRAITSVGLSVTDVAVAASTTPARRLGLDGVTGSLRAGLAADIVLLDPDFRLRAVIARGECQHQEVR